MIDATIRRKQNFLLRLPLSIREHAHQLAHDEGTSLNHFISLAVAERVSRIEQDRAARALSQPGYVPVGIRGRA